MPVNLGVALSVYKNFRNGDYYGKLAGHDWNLGNGWWTVDCQLHVPVCINSQSRSSLWIIICIDFFFFKIIYLFPRKKSYFDSIVPHLSKRNDKMSEIAHSSVNLHNDDYRIIPKRTEDVFVVYRLQSIVPDGIEEVEKGL